LRACRDLITTGPPAPDRLQARTPRMKVRTDRPPSDGPFNQCQRGRPRRGARKIPPRPRRAGPPGWNLLGVSVASIEDFPRRYRINIRGAVPCHSGPPSRASSQQKGGTVFIHSTVVSLPAQTSLGLPLLRDTLREEVNSDEIRVVNGLSTPDRRRTPAQIHALEGRPYLPSSVFSRRQTSPTSCSRWSPPARCRDHDVRIRRMLKN
jgi:hypothetical protein